MSKPHCSELYVTFYKHTYDSNFMFIKHFDFKFSRIICSCFLFCMVRESVSHNNHKTSTHITCIIRIWIFMFYHETHAMVLAYNRISCKIIENWWKMFSSSLVMHFYCFLNLVVFPDTILLFMFHLFKYPITFAVWHMKWS